MCILGPQSASPVPMEQGKGTSGGDTGGRHAVSLGGSPLY